MYNQYMMSLGEFAMDGFDDHPQTYAAYLIFLTATFVTQITFLNMLIAIMGDTFGRVIENQAQYGLQTKLSIMGDYSELISSSKRVMDYNNFLFVVRPKAEVFSAEGNWEGSLSQIKK